MAERVAVGFFDALGWVFEVGIVICCQQVSSLDQDSLQILIIQAYPLWLHKGGERSQRREKGCTKVQF